MPIVWEFMATFSEFSLFLKSFSVKIGLQPMNWLTKMVDSVIIYHLGKNIARQISGSEWRKKYATLGSRSELLGFEERQKIYL